MDKKSNNHLFLEIAHRIKVEELLRQSKEQFKAAFEHAPVAMFLINDGNVIEKANRAAIKMCNMPNSPHAFSLKELIENNILPMQAEIACCPHKNHEFSEVQCVDDSGQKRYLRIIAVKMRPSNYLSRWILMIDDVTESVESKKLQSTISQRILEAHEEEKQQISREIHDTISQSLAALKMAIQSGSDKEALIDTVNQLIESSRILSQSLRPEIIDNLGLIPAIQQCAKGISTRFNTVVTVKSLSQDVSLSPTKSLELFRISQEAITNAAHHGQARSIQVSILKRNNRLKIVVVDDGRGFDQRATSETSKKSNSLGLKIMLERAKHIGAVFNIHSKPGRGTTVSVSCHLD